MSPNPVIAALPPALIMNLLKRSGMVRVCVPLIKLSLSNKFEPRTVFSNYVSWPQGILISKGTKMIMLQKLPTPLIATFKLAGIDMFSRIYIVNLSLLLKSPFFVLFICVSLLSLVSIPSYALTPSNE